MLSDFVTYYLAPQRLTADLANSARPDAPTRPEPEPAQPGAKLVPVRQRLSVGLRRLADTVEPEPRPHSPAATNRG